MPLRRPPPRSQPTGAPLRARAATADETYDEEDYEGSEEPNMKFSHAVIVVLILHLVAVGGVFAFNWMKARQTAEAKSPKPALAASASSKVAEPTTPEKSSVIAGWKGKTHTVAAGENLTRIAAIQGSTLEAIEKENGLTTYSIIQVGQVLKIPGAEPRRTETKKPETAATKPASASTAAVKQAFLATKTDLPKPIAATVISAVPLKKTPETPAKAAPSPAAIMAVAASDDSTYVVAKGDNPYLIAKKLKVSYNALISANNIKDPTKIQIGQKLKVPKKD